MVIHTVHSCKKKDLRFMQSKCIIKCSKFFLHREKELKSRFVTKNKMFFILLQTCQSIIHKRLFGLGASKPMHFSQVIDFLQYIRNNVARNII